MKKLAAVVLLACSLVQVQAQAQAQADTVWLTVSGNGDDPAVNTIQVDPVPLEVKDEVRIMRVRVSRSVLRTSWDGVPYRSYESRVQFDCSENTARYLSLTYYMQPGWKGESHKTSSYGQGTPRMMEFRDVQPNPNTRIIRAACLGITR